MGLFFTFRHKTNDPGMLPGWHPTSDFGFWKPFLHLDQLPTPTGRALSIGDFLGVPEEVRRDGTDFFVPPWKDIHERGSEILVEVLTESIWGEEEGVEPEHRCGCPDCLQYRLGPLVRLMRLVQFALKSGEPHDYGFSWSP